MDIGIIKLDLVTEDEDILIKIKNAIKYTGNINHYHDKYKERIALKPTEVELHYLESIKNLEKLENKN